MNQVDKYRKQFADLRDSILIAIGIIIRKQPNWYMQVNDVQGKLIYNEISFSHAEVILSVTVRDDGVHGEREIVWVGTHEEETDILVENLDTNLMINLLEAMEKELE